MGSQHHQTKYDVMTSDSLIPNHAMHSMAAQHASAVLMHICCVRIAGRKLLNCKQPAHAPNLKTSDYKTRSERNEPVRIIPMQVSTTIDRDTRKAAVQAMPDNSAAAS